MKRKAVISYHTYNCFLNNLHVNLVEVLHVTMYKNSRSGLPFCLTANVIVTDFLWVTSSLGGCSAILILHKTPVFWNTFIQSYTEKYRLQNLKYCIYQFPCIRLFRLVNNVVRKSAFHNFPII